MSERKILSAERRRIIRISALAGGGAAAAVLVPVIGADIIARIRPKEGEVIELALDNIAPGQMARTEWKGQPVWVLHRTPEMIAAVHAGPARADPDSSNSRQPANCTNLLRSIRPEYFVAIGLCTHLGCEPTPRFAAGRAEGMPADWPGGFICPCHTSRFDLAGRAFAGREAKTNLRVPPHEYLTETRLQIGEYGHL
jgi:ubiquinol-cytochrome c reductase iron-sulfur subunit